LNQKNNPLQSLMAKPGNLPYNHKRRCITK